MHRIYLSSTYEDLKDYRDAVARALRRLDHQVVGMEDYVAADERPLDKCLEDVAACDVYVGIFAWRFGYVPPKGNPKKRSITELEYREATRLKKPRLIFLLGDDAPWPPKLVDKGTSARSVKALRDELAEARLASFFKHPNELAELATAAVTKWDRIVDTVLHNRFETGEVPLVRNRLAVIAHGMHTGEGLNETRETPEAQATEDEIDRMLEAYQQANYTEEGFKRVNEARDQLLSQSGLLLPLESRHASFYHLSFQEFLAAERMADVERDRLLDVLKQRGEKPDWRNTLSFLYGSQLANNVAPKRAVDLLLELLAGFSDSTGPVQALLAADCVEILRGRRVRLDETCLGGIRDLCLAGMGGEWPAILRCDFGEALGRIGDPRFRADAWHLPADDLLGFVEIPGGPFRMGSEESRDSNASGNELPQHEVELGRYFVARYPVTVAQFRAFAEDVAVNGGFKPSHPDCLRGVANHPVVLVSWEEAMAYCDWLTAKLRSSDCTPEPLREILVAKKPATGWRITLPSEAQWEKAARGTDGRIFPWGDQEDADKANCADARIQSTSAVGCFPGGASPYGVEELSGNVWEWCRDWYGAYASGTVTHPSGPIEGQVRMLRGGARFNTASVCRSAFRIVVHPTDRGNGIGFRVVLAPRSGSVSEGRATVRERSGAGGIRAGARDERRLSSRSERDFS